MNQEIMMNQQIRISRKRTEELFLKVDELSKTLALRGFDQSGSNFWTALEAAYSTLLLILEKESDRLTSLVRTASRS